MNENPGGTPNPLNPSPLDANPSEPMEEVKAPQKIEVQSEPVQSEPIQNEPINPVPGQLTEELVEESVMVDSLDPEGRQMEKIVEVPAPAPEKKPKKTGLIVGLIICLFVAVCCGVVAILLFMSGDKDPFAAAAKKIINGNIPDNVAISGTIEIESNDSSSPVTNAKIVIDSKSKTTSLINNTTADITLTLTDEKELVYKLSEIYAENDDLYIKVEDKTVVEDDLVIVTDCVDGEAEGTDCVKAETTNCEGVEGTNCTEPTTVECEGDECPEATLDIDLAEIFSGVVEMIDGEWIRIPIEEMSSFNDESAMFENDMMCLVDVANEIEANINSIAELYNKNPFFSSVAENIPINSKLNTIRQVTVDDEKLANFINSVGSVSAINDMYDCLGVEGRTDVTASEITTAISKLPAVYVEVDSDTNISRVYTRILSEDESATMTIDLSLTYPSTINVSAPVEYKSLDEILEEVMPQLFNVETIDDTEVETNS
ncbi:hypothetical protein J6V85_01575 [Candidatus Saccharibacteria bacterium]|nr:hypothetical protein [Candidatus Saccharibacteria bacterium]